MPRSRTWNLRLNLDEFNAAFAALGDDVERSQFLAGISRGMNGGATREGASTSFSEGFGLGQGMRLEAEEYRRGRAENGRKGGRKGTTKEPHGNHEGTTGEPPVNQSGTQSTIHNPLTTTPHPLIKPSCPESASPASRQDPGEAVFVLPCKGSGAKTWPVSQRMLHEWQEAFPGVELMPQLHQMRLWLQNNPQKAKTARGMSTFVLGWLGRAQDRPRPASRPGFSGRPASLADQEYLEEFLTQEPGRAS
jgi:hypothetical protein